MDTLSIRQAGADDIAALALLFDQYRQFYHQPPDYDLAYNFIADRIHNSESVILIACDNHNVLLGFCQLYPTFCSVSAAKIFVLYDLFTNAQARGKGVATALLSAAEQKAVHTGVIRMDLSTAHNNHNAQRLYESMGWQQDMEFRTYSKTI